MKNRVTEMTVNRPLSNTYRWLRVNGTNVSLPRMDDAFALGWGMTSCVEDKSPAALHLRTGMGLALDAVQEKPYRAGFTAKAGRKSVLRLGIDLNRETQSGGLSLHVEEGGELTAVLDIHSLENAAQVSAVVQTLAVVEKDAVLRLTTVQRLKEDDRLLNDLGVQCGENARFEYVRLFLGGAETYDGCSVALEGNQSSFEADIGYQLGGKAKLDMNYESVHTGRKTDCAIHAAGVLSGGADKLFRGTIDFRKGCSGSTGDETEDVLMMDETVRNRTVPVILCSEEDVDGSHGATIGRLDESLVYYLESRGLSREAVYRLCAAGKIDAVIRKIPDPETIQRLFPRFAEEGEAAM